MGIKFGFNFDNSYLKLPEVFYKKSNLNNFESPKLVLLNEDLAKDLKLDINQLKDQGAYILSGNIKIDGGAYISQAYAGHQFGHFTMLGDGRATLIGEHSLCNEKYDIQLKGSGKTDFSRGGDGNAVLGPMIREYIISEAMYYLGISTTRSLAVVDTGEYVLRDGYERGAILTRVAKSHIRFGTFEYARNFCSEDELKKLADYTISRHYSYLENEEDKYLKFLQQVIKIQAELVAKWQSVGFIHGVMNTDNMSIVGETIDYGPCAFMNIYKPDTVFSSIDRFGRYAYKNQPIICKWNLCRLAEAIASLINKDLEKALNILEIEIGKFDNIFNEKFIEIMGKKLGIFNTAEKDIEIIQNFLKILENNEYDYNNSFVMLTQNIEKPMYNNTEFLEWFKIWQERISNQGKSIKDIEKLMKSTNPSFIPRNNLVEEVILQAKKGNFEYLKEFLKEIKNPYSYNFNEKFNVKYEELKKSYKTFCGT